MSIPGKFSKRVMCFPLSPGHRRQADRLLLRMPRGWRLIVIYRGKHCPLCKQYLGELEKLKDEFAAAGIAVWALSADPVERAQEDAMMHGWTFPLLAGLGEEQMRQLGLYMSAPRSPVKPTAISPSRPSS